MQFTFSYRFYPAGQGIFASGMLWDDTPAKSTESYRWIFDCGSTSPTAVLQPHVVDYRAAMSGNYVGLICISHFDFDHVSGLQSLLSGLRVGTIVLPYYTASDRLVLGALRDETPGFYRDFLSNPIAWLLETADSIEQIIIVGEDGGPGGGYLPDRLPNPKPGPRGKPDPERKWQFKTDLEREAKPQENKNSSKPRLPVSEETKKLAEQLGTQLLQQPSSFRAELQFGYHAAWEFMFYHKPQPSGIEKKLREGIKKLLIPSDHGEPLSSPPNPWETLATNGIHSVRRTLFKMLRPGGVTSETDLLTALSSRETVRRIKKVYSDVLGGDDQLNAASLCVYSGPVVEFLPPDKWNILEPYCDPHINSISRRHRTENQQPLCQCSILYTGDADFRAPSDRARLRGFLDMKRWQAVAVLQVPHHGSRYNWQPGSAAEFHHRWSVFCADPHYKHKHPHQEVLVDLIHHGSRLADKVRQWEWWGQVELP
jgi:hypothetical protein